MEQFKTKLIPVPAEIFDELGFEDNMILEVYAENGKIVIGMIDDTDDYICDSDCENCPRAQECEDEFKMDFEDSGECLYCCPECGICLRDSSEK